MPINAKEIVRDNKADFVVHHDGEETVCEVVDNLESEALISKVDGLTWKGDDGTVVTNKGKAYFE